MYGYNSSLVLRNLERSQAGSYHCKASNEHSTIKSSLAYLTVVGKQRKYQLKGFHRLGSQVSARVFLLMTRRCVAPISQKLGNPVRLLNSVTAIHGAEAMLAENDGKAWRKTWSRPPAPTKPDPPPATSLMFLCCLIRRRFHPLAPLRVQESVASSRHLVRLPFNCFLPHTSWEQGLCPP